MVERLLMKTHIFHSKYVPSLRRPGSASERHAPGWVWTPLLQPLLQPLPPSQGATWSPVMLPASPSSPAPAHQASSLLSSSSLRRGWAAWSQERCPSCRAGRLPSALGLQAMEPGGAYWSSLAVASTRIWQASLQVTHPGFLRWL